MITKHVIKSCCGGVEYSFETEKAIKKPDLEIFKKHGYLSPPHYAKCGIFYVQFKSLSASGSFGMRRLRVVASGKNAEQLLDSFEKLLDSVTSK